MLSPSLLWKTFEVSLKYWASKVILQELSSDGNKFHFKDMSEIGNRDLVYFMGIVPDSEERGIFSIYSNAVIGQNFKTYTEQFQINTSTQISGINSAYTRNDYLIQMDGKLYILVAIKKDAYTGSLDEDVDAPTGEKQEEKAKKNVSWIFFLLGGIGVLGGGFLIMRLRRRVRAA